MTSSNPTSSLPWSVWLRRVVGRGIEGGFRLCLSVLGGGRTGSTGAARWPADAPLLTVVVLEGRPDADPEATAACIAASTQGDLEVLELPAAELAVALQGGHGKHFVLLVAGSRFDAAMLERLTLALEGSSRLVDEAASAPDGPVTALAFRRDATPPELAARLAAGGDPRVELARLARRAGGGSGLARLLPSGLRTGLGQALRDHRLARASDGGLGEFGRGLRSDDLPLVVWIVPWLGAGGIEEVLLALAVQLGDRYRFAFLLTLPAANEWRDRFVRAGVHVYDLPRLLARRCWSEFLRRTVRCRAPRAVLCCHSEHGYEMLASIRAEFPDLALFDVLHNDSELGYVVSAVRNDRILRHVAVSARIRSTLADRYGLAPARITVIENGVDTTRFDPALFSSEREPGAGAVVVGFIGRLAEEKDPGLFVDVAAELAGGGPEFRFRIAGDGPLRGAVAARIAGHGLGERIELCGRLDGEAVPRFLAGVDLCVLTSRVEGSPLVVLEALAMGVPVVATHVGNLSSFLTPPLGRVVGERSPTALAAAARALLAEPRATAGARRRFVLERHGLQAMAAGYERLWRGPPPA